MIEFEVKGMEKVRANFEKFASEFSRGLFAAGREVAEEILDTTGLRKYPKAGAGNRPPTPYYKRGVGMQYKHKNDGRSERYGTQFFVKQNLAAEGAYIRIGNRASYAKYLTDAKHQSRAMARIGWRKMIDVAREKTEKAVEIYSAWVAKMLKDASLQ